MLYPLLFNNNESHAGFVAPQVRQTTEHDDTRGLNTELRKESEYKMGASPFCHVTSARAEQDETRSTTHEQLLNQDEDTHVHS